MLHPQTPVEPARDRAQPDRDDMFDTVARIVADVLDSSTRDVGSASTLLQLGAESLMFVEIVLKLENTYGIRIDRSYALPGAHTVHDYVKAVHAGLAEKAGESM